MNEMPGHWHTIYKHPTRPEYRLSKTWGPTPEPSHLPSWDRETGRLYIGGVLVEPSRKA